MILLLQELYKGEILDALVTMRASIKKRYRSRVHSKQKVRRPGARVPDFDAPKKDQLALFTTGYFSSELADQKEMTTREALLTTTHAVDSAPPCFFFTAERINLIT
jgi:hypothetical protein